MSPPFDARIRVTLVGGQFNGKSNGNGKRRSRSLRDDNQKGRAGATATAKEEADPCGMTTKKAGQEQRQRRNKKQIPAG